MSDEPSIRVRPDVVFRPLGDGAVLVNLTTDDIYELNETATAIWSGVIRGLPPSAIGHMLEQEFVVSKEDAVTAVVAVLDDLRRAGLLE